MISGSSGWSAMLVAILLVGKIAALARPWASRWLDWLLGGSLTHPRRLTIHSPVLLHLYPLRTMRPWYLTQQSILVNVTLYPALQSRTTDNSECDMSPGMMCARRVFYGRLVTHKEHVCDECTCAPSGWRTVNGVSSGLKSSHGGSMTKK